jgi:hypothetical protein
MPTYITRAGKGAPLLNDEVDANFVHIEAPVMELWARMTANFNAVAKGRYYCVGAITATLPAAPPDGTEIWFSGSFKTTNMTVARNGATIVGSATDLILDMDNIMPKLVYNGGNWRVAQ